MQPSTRIVVVAPPELTPGFKLAGATALEATTVAEAEAAVLDLIGGGERGVIAVYEPLMSRFGPALRDRLIESVAPVVVALPSGLEVEADASRRARLAALLRRAVGYHITFGEEDR